MTWGPFQPPQCSNQNYALACMHPNLPKPSLEIGPRMILSGLLSL